MRKILDVDYLYATAHLRALEKNMLTARDLDKMLDATTLEESYKVANDISLHSRLDCTHYEEAIAGMLAGAYALIDELSGGSDIFDIFRYKYDGHNLKVLVKSQALSGDPMRIMSPLGILPKEAAAAQFREKKLEGLPERIAEAAYKASETLAKSGDPQQVDILLDRAVMESMLEKAEEIDFPFLTEVVRSIIDVENLRTFVRLKRMGRDAGMMRALAVDGGKVSPTRLCDAFGPEGFDALREMLSITDYAGYFGHLLEGMNERTPLTAFERGADNYILHLLQSSRLVAFGLEPLIGFILAKESEAKQVRIALASRAAGVPREKISERMRETYA